MSGRDDQRSHTGSKLRKSLEGQNSSGNRAWYNERSIRKHGKPQENGLSWKEVKLGASENKVL